MKPKTENEEPQNPEVNRLLDTVFNPRLHVYRQLEMWESWLVLAKGGRNPPIYTRWKREAWENIGSRIVAP